MCGVLGAKYWVVVIGMLLMACLPAHAAKIAAPAAKEGVVDFGDWDFAHNGIAKLVGEWEFYWQQLLEPKAFRQASPPAQTGLISLPRDWNGYPVNGQPLDSDGFATFRLKVKISDPERPYALRLMTASSAYALWVNGICIASNGKVARSKADMLPQYHPQVVAFDAKAENEFILQVSNFHHRRGGAWNSISLGHENQIRAQQRSRINIDMFLLGTLLIMAFYHFGLFALRLSDPSTLYFGLFCLDIGLRITVYRDMVIDDFITVVNWEWLSKTRYVTSFLAVPLFMMFVRSLYPQEFSLKALRASQLLAAGFILFILLTDTRTFSPVMFAHYLITSVFCLYTTYVLARAALHKREGVWWFIVGFAVLFPSIINDILSDMGYLSTDYLVSTGVFIFIFSQAFILSLRFSSAFTRVGSLTTAYERFVPKEFLQHLGKDDIVNLKLGDNTQRDMTVLFSDIRSFTAMSETMTPQNNFNFLNAYLGRMEPVIARHHGFIDKFIGDSIMALFDKSADDAVQAAIEMLHALKTYNHHRQHSGYQAVAVGIGINSGSLMLGTIGGKARMESTVISDTVNLASRMENMTKWYGTSILITENTLLELADPSSYLIRPIDHVRAYGKAQPVGIFEVFDADPPGLREGKRLNQPLFEQAVARFTEGQPEVAQALFLQYHALVPEDTVVGFYLRRIAGEPPGRHYYQQEPANMPQMAQVAVSGK